MKPKLISNDKVYVHFGHTALNKDEFKSLSLSDAIPVRKEKPVGGLWASPKEEPTWQEWCACEGYHIESVHRIQSQEAVAFRRAVADNHQGVLMNIIIFSLAMIASICCFITTYPQKPNTPRATITTKEYTRYLKVSQRNDVIQTTRISPYSMEELITCGAQLLKQEGFRISDVKHV